MASALRRTVTITRHRAIMSSSLVMRVSPCFSPLYRRPQRRRSPAWLAVTLPALSDDFSGPLRASVYPRRLGRVGFVVVVVVPLGSDLSSKLFVIGGHRPCVVGCRGSRSRCKSRYSVGGHPNPVSMSWIFTFGAVSCSGSRANVELVISRCV